MNKLFHVKCYIERTTILFILANHLCFTAALNYSQMIKMKLMLLNLNFARYRFEPF